MIERYNGLDTSWTGIRRNGLLSTQSLVELYKPGPEESCAILRRHRPESIEISCYGLCTATIRDQKPMDDKGVCRALGVRDPNPWYELLNSMVFLWPTKKRLRTIMKAYKCMSHDLLVVDTARLVDRHRGKIRLSRMNSGATKPFPHPRTFDLFKTFEDFPFDERLMRYRYKVANAVAEVCVVDGIQDIGELVVKVHEKATIDDLKDL